MPNTVGHVLDDDSGMLRAISRQLRSHGYQVEAYASAERFLRQEVSSTSACLVVDLKMPEIGESELQKVLSKADCYPPIIFLRWIR